MTTEETTTEEETTYVKVERSDVRGSRSSQSVDAEQLTSMSHEESTRFVIKGVLDPRTGSEISMDEVSAARRPLSLYVMSFYHDALNWWILAVIRIEDSSLVRRVICPKDRLAYRPKQCSIHDALCIQGYGYTFWHFCCRFRADNFY